jgi:hypothetical protein
MATISWAEFFAPGEHVESIFTATDLEQWVTYKKRIARGWLRLLFTLWLTSIAVCVASVSRHAQMEFYVATERKITLLFVLHAAFLLPLACGYLYLWCCISRVATLEFEKRRVIIAHAMSLVNKTNPELAAVVECYKEDTTLPPLVTTSQHSRRGSKAGLNMAELENVLRKRQPPLKDVATEEKDNNQGKNPVG